MLGAVVVVAVVAVVPRGRPGLEAVAQGPPTTLPTGAVGTAVAGATVATTTLDWLSLLAQEAPTTRDTAPSALTDVQSMEDAELLMNAQ